VINYASITQITPHLQMPTALIQPACAVVQHNYLPALTKYINFITFITAVCYYDRILCAKKNNKTLAVAIHRCTISIILMLFVCVVLNLSFGGIFEKKI